MWQLLGSGGPELDSGWRGRVGSSAVLDLLAFRAFLTVVDFSALWLLVFFRALLLGFSSSSFGPLVVSLLYFRLGSECEGLDVVPGGLEWY